MRRRAVDTAAAVEGKPADTNSAVEPARPSVSPGPSRWLDLQTRTAAAVAMLSLCLAVLWLGHLAVSCFVVVLQSLVFRELLALGYEKAKDGMIPRYRTLSWYFFGALEYFVYGKAFLVHFSSQGATWTDTAVVRFLIRHHTFVIFILYIIGFVTFVLTLKAGHYATQFSHYGRTIVALIIVVIQSHFLILNIKRGMAWFVLPTALVVCNDTFAYICGRLFGKTSLLAISPKKTLEGFIGAVFITIIAAFFMAGELQKYDFMRCPLDDLSSCNLLCRTTCDPPRTFIPQEISLGGGNPLVLPGLQSVLHAPRLVMHVSPFQVHAVWLGIFASLIAPFGGFFASGAKRAFEVKDFASFIPGHGGVTDRVDCQFLMAMFTYVYWTNFALYSAPDVQNFMVFASDLAQPEQQELFVELGKMLLRKGVNATHVLSEAL